MFHWPLEFPEVIVKRGGFDAFVGNPPYMGGQKITRNISTQYRDFIVAQIANGATGSADLCVYFLLRISGVSRSNGTLGLVATSSLAEGDSREVGLARFDELGMLLYRAIDRSHWPGHASVTYTGCDRASAKDFHEIRAVFTREWLESLPGSARGY